MKSAQDSALHRSPLWARVLAVIVALAIAGGAGFLLRDRMAAAVVQDAAPVKQAVNKINGVTVVTVDAATQEHSGIRVRQLAAAQHKDDALGTAIVIDLQPILDLHSRYDGAVSERAAAAALADAAHRESERDRILYLEDQNISLKVSQAAEAASRAANARLDSATRNVADVAGALRTQFGDALARWATDPRSAAFQRLLTHRDALLRVTPPAGFSSDSPHIEVAGSDNKRQGADLVGFLQMADPALNGSSILYRTTATAATANGARLTAFLPSRDHPVAGVVVPTSALVWYGGRPWAYVQTAPDGFSRVPVTTDFPMEQGYFVAAGIQAGARVVDAGAQLLLSEELKPRTGGSACKDPACD
ncbi:MAG: hypothetical protein NVS3B2_17810 [Ramlibacter sp.]